MTMKKKVIYMIVAVALVAMAACTNEQIGEGSEVGQTDVEITFSPYEVEPMTRASVADFATRLDVWIYEGGVEKHAAHQQSADDDFASLSLTLDKTKTYTLYAVAHKAAGAATLSNGVVSWPEDKVTHSFFYTETFSPATKTTLNCVMERIVGNFRIEITDAVPSNVTSMTVAIGGSPTRWDVAGYGVNPVERTATFSPAAGTTPTLSVFIISEAEEAVNYDLTLTALDDVDNVVQERTFEDVPIRNGYRSTYRGAFFTDVTAGMAFTVKEWSDYETVDF